MVLKINEKVISRKIDGEYFLVEVKKSMLHNLNETATLIIEEIEKGSAEEKIIDLITSEYEVTKSDAKKDFDELIEKLIEMEILTKNK